MSDSLTAVAALLGTFLASYAIGSIPFAYIIVKGVTGEDITTHGTGNVGAMNVRRTTGSWSWFVVAMLADAMKGFVPVLAMVLVPRMFADTMVVGQGDWSTFAAQTPAAALMLWGPAAAVLGAVVGHNWSLWLSVTKHRLLGGKGLATGGGALLAYDWRYFLIVVVAGLLVIAITRYMMAGQVTAAVVLPLYTVITRQPDWPFAVALGLIVYSRHHRRFVGLLRGQEPKMYIEDRMGPRG